MKHSEDSNKIEGEFTVLPGHDHLEVELPRSWDPTQVEVTLLHPPIPPCDPHHHHHHDHVEWSLRRHEHHQVMLKIKWRIVSGPRKVHWSVCY